MILGCSWQRRGDNLRRWRTSLNAGLCMFFGMAFFVGLYHDLFLFWANLNMFFSDVILFLMDSFVGYLF